MTSAAASDDTVLAAVRIPPALRGPGVADAPSHDVTVRDGRVTDIRPQTGVAQAMLLSAPVDLHVHLDKNHLVSRTGAAEGDLFRAIAMMQAERERITADDVHARMARGLAEAYAEGTRALRTHLDWRDAPAPLALEPFVALRAEWAGRLDLQFVSLTPLDLFADAAASEALARQVAAAGGLLGAFIYRNDDLPARVARVFELARAYDLDIDFHVDEGLHADARGLREIALACERYGWQGRVTCGHACSLSVQPPDEAAQTLALCAAAGVGVVALPTTNAYLQGAWDATPLERGITRLREARAAGVPLAIATDNVADPFYPYGSYALLDNWALGVMLAHLAPAEDWLDTITVQPARAMRLAWDGRIAPGCPADLLWVGAGDGLSLLQAPGRRRRVMRAGRWLD